MGPVKPLPPPIPAHRPEAPFEDPAVDARPPLPALLDDSTLALPTSFTRRDRVLQAWARFTTTRPLLTLLLCIITALASVAYTVTTLEFRADRSQLVDPSLPWQKRYANFRSNFAAWDEPAVVVVRMGKTDESRATGERFLQRLESRLAADPRFPRFIAGFPQSDAPAGLIFTQSLESIRSIVVQLAQAGPALASPSLADLLSLSRIAATSMTPAQRDGLRNLLTRAAAVADGRPYSILGVPAPDTIQRLTTRSGDYAMALVSLDHVSAQPAAASIVNGASADAIDSAGAAVHELRQHLRELRAEPGLGSVSAGVTGIPVLESDETSLSMRDAALAGALSLIGITLLLLIAYRGFVVPLLAVSSLLIGMAWAFAWATMAVGHLQLLSITFASLLMGLGIDVAIHLIARLELVHPDHDHLAPAIAQAFKGVGPGIITASVTVAAAAGAMAFTDFAGVAEMGLIAAGGILLCTLSIMTALPAMFMLMPRPESRLRAHDGGEARPFMGRAGIVFHRHPKRLISVAAVALVFAAYFASGVRYDTDLLRLVPSTTESVRWQHALEDDDARSVWHAVAETQSLDRARDLTALLRELHVVSDVDGAGMLFPDPAKVEQAQVLLAGLPDPSLIDIFASASQSDEQKTQRLRAALLALADQWKSANPEFAATATALADANLSAVEDAYAQDRITLAKQMQQLRSAEPPTLESLPPALREQIVGADGSLLLRIYPNDSGSSASVLAPERLTAFATAVLAQAPQATGPSIQIYESTRLINAAYIKAGIFALLAIFIILVLDFRPTRRGIGDALCALFPVVSGAILMLAMMRLFGVDLNFANMIVMPLIVGIGVGSGVHVVRRWRLQPRDEPAGLAGGSGRAITLTTFTTVMGFATMMTAQHRGIQSLGFTMTVGLLMVWLVTIIALPAILRLRKSPAAG